MTSLDNDEILSTGIYDQLSEVGFLGVWDCDFVTGQAHASPDVCRFFGIEPGEGFEVPYEAFEARMHPDDVDWVRHHRVRSVGESGIGVIEYRILDAAGQTHWVMCRAKYDIEENGRLAAGRGVMFDVTDFKREGGRIHAPSDDERTTLHRLTDLTLECYGLAKQIHEPRLVTSIGDALIRLGHMLSREGRKGDGIDGTSH